ncbi:hypothetical protein ACGF3C_19595 [Micromonospora sp. NPDC047762]|uniref:hypothetical protein n=1 Tax=Micromonospora sp. NPDC047762 TaxID=3364255 RepID=UPI00371D720A
MPATDGVVIGHAEELISSHATLTGDPRRGLGHVARYLCSEHDPPYAPRGAKAEYLSLARKSITNWLPLISETYVKGLFVDGYRPAKATTNARPWESWQANRDANRCGDDFKLMQAWRRRIPERGEGHVLA